jgi:phosphate/sulfate permease
MSGAATRRSTSDTARWAARTAVIGSVVGASMVLLGMEPHLALVGAVVVLTAAASWLISGLVAVADPLSWYAHGSAAGSTARPDRRVQLLTARLRHNTRHSSRRRTSGLEGPGDTQPLDEIVGSLIAVLDDHLRTQHGIDRATNVQAANDALGPELARFMNDPENARAMTQRRTLAHTIALIEAFTASTGQT